MVSTVENVLRPHIWLDNGWWNCAVREDGITFQQASGVTPEIAYAYWLFHRPPWVQRAVLARFPSLTHKVLVHGQGYGQGFLS